MVFCCPPTSLSQSSALVTLYHIDVVLLDRLAIKAIGNLPQSVDVAGKTLARQLIRQCLQFGAAFLIGFGYCDAEGCLEFPVFAVLGAE
jgi:hypothetical protein